MRKDYLCFVSMGMGSCWGYGETPAEAVSYMLIEINDWADYYKVSDIYVPSTIYDLTEYGGFVADHRGLYGQLPGDGEGEMQYSEKPLEPSQYALSKTPKTRTKNGRWSELKSLRSALTTHFYPTYNEVMEAKDQAQKEANDGDK